MKKLIIAAAAAAMVGGAYAACERCTVEQDVARVYKVQMNVYTTRGARLTKTSVIGGNCERGTETSCKVIRGKDKTMFRGYVYICENLCDITDYAAVFADVYRRVELSNVTFAWSILNAIGGKQTDAECAWTFEATSQYDEQRAQEWALTGAGYGKYINSSYGYFDNLSGYFAGTATASFDLRSKPTGEEDDCTCDPSQVLKCSNETGLEWTDSDTVAFGAWKMKYDPEIVKAYLVNGPSIFPTLIKRMFR